MQASAFQPYVFAFLLPGHRGYVTAKGGSCNFFIDMSERMGQRGCRWYQWHRQARKLVPICSRMQVDFSIFTLLSIESMPILEGYWSEVSVSNLLSAPSLWGTFVGDDGRFFLSIIAVVMFYGNSKGDHDTMGICITAIMHEFYICEEMIWHCALDVWL